MSKHRVVIVGVSQQLRGQAGGPCLALDQVREADLLKIFRNFFSLRHLWQGKCLLSLVSFTSAPHLR